MSAPAPSRHLAYLEGAFVETSHPREIRSPMTGEVVAIAFDGDKAALERAVSAAASAFRPFRSTSRHLRSRLLAKMAEGIEHRRAEMTSVIVAEAGKPTTLAAAEVSRAVGTFTIASEEAKRYGGEVLPIDVDAAGRAYDLATVRLVPRGPVLAITPFNFPLNLVAHKVAPALAVGAPVLVKPAPAAPGPTRILAEIFAEAAKSVADARESIPLAAFQILGAPNDVASLAVQDERLSVLSFTGSAQVGWSLQSAARGKRVLLELGGDAAVIVHEDADLARAAARCAFGAYAYAGQVCISVQRILVHERAIDRFRALYLDEVRKVAWGDPEDPRTLSGPVINSAAADRISEVLDEATAGGGKLLLGGERKGNLLAPAVVEDAPLSSRLAGEEVFGPVSVLSRYSDLDAAIEQVNRSRYGLQAGVFTDSLAVRQKVASDLDAGGILINEVPTYRADHVPYGGMKASGLGREGLRYAMQEYSEQKTIIEWRG